MKKMSFTGRIFLGLLITAVISGVLAKAFTNIAEREDPFFVEKAFDQINRKWANAKDFSEVREEDISDVRNLIINSVAGDIVVEAYDGTTLKVEYSGKVPEKHADQLVSLQKNNGELSLDFLPSYGSGGNSFTLQWNDKIRGFNFDGDSHLEAKILVPKTFNRSMRIKTIKGDIDLNGVNLQNLNLNSVAGDIEIDHAVLETINITTVKGDVETNAVSGKNWAIKTVSGDVNLFLLKPQDMNFELQSVSGNIEQGGGPGSSKDAKGLIKVKTVSGDITIHRFTEEPEDRD